MIHAALAQTSGERDLRRQTAPPPTPEPRTLIRCLTVLAVAGVCWLASQLLMRLALVSFTLAVAVLLTALLSWPVGRLKRAGTPAGVAASIGLIALITVPAVVGLLLWTRIGNQMPDLAPAATAGIDDIRAWLTTGPLSLDPSQIDHLRDQIVSFVDQVVPSPVAGARIALNVLVAFLLALFAVFFFLKDGDRMWQWALERTPQAGRDRVDGAGRVAWTTLTSCVTAATLVAVIDAALIGGGLFFVGVPLWPSLALLTFLGAFVPILGATVTGVVAVLVTLVTNGASDAVIILGVVLVVQQVEGNLLHPLLMGRAVHLHPVVTLVAVTCGTLLLGIPGAMLAVPLVAVSYRIAEFVRTDRRPQDVHDDPPERSDRLHDAATRSPGSALRAGRDAEGTVHPSGTGPQSGLPAHTS
jgi:predicted PurR-regulated permease PerM